MKYYYIDETREIKTIGHYPQTSASKDKRGHFDGYDSQLRMYYNRFPDFEPKYALDLHSNSIATDIIDKASLPFGFVVGQKLKNLLEELNLPPHRFYPINVYGTELNYYWFHYITNIWNYIDFESSEIEVVHKFKFNVEEIKTFTSFDEIMTFKKSLPRQNILRFGAIRLNNNFPNYDIFEITGPQYFTLISEKLKNKLLEKNITGIGITQYDKLTYPSSI